ncbi:response regulator transcription factor [Patescibacteria group bacterium]|nr:MAG: response regulator transcription factor [Patescibacteria group bacterium]
MIRVNGAKKAIVRGSAVRLTWLLSPREIEVLRLLTEGNANKVIAEKLGISEKTVESHRSNIHGKFRQLTGHTFPMELLVQMAVRSGIATPAEFPFLVFDPPPS